MCIDIRRQKDCIRYIAHCKFKINAPISEVYSIFKRLEALDYELPSPNLLI